VKGITFDFSRLNPETGFGPERIPNFDFPDADIMEVAKAIQKLTGINIISDGEVKGRISILAPSPITVGDAWRAFLTALDIRGYTMVKQGKFFKVIRNRQAKESPIKTYAGRFTPNMDNYITRVIPLKFIGADEIARNFRMFIGRDARIITIEQTNTIIVTDTGSNIHRLLNILKILDISGHEQTLEVVQVAHASAQDIAKLLEQILGSISKGGRSTRRSGRNFGGGKGGQIKTKDGGVISQIIADERTNSLVILANSLGLQKIRELVRKLDRPVMGERGGKIHVYYLQYADAEEIAKVLQALSRGSSSGAKKGKKGAPKPQGAAEFEGGVKITADKSNNALVIVASPGDYTTLKSLLAKIDIPRDQVLVEAVIMEISLRNIEQFAVNWTMASKQFGILGSAPTKGYLNFVAGGDSTAFLSDVAGIFNLARSDKTISVNINGQDTDIPTMTSFINFFEGNTNSNILSRPQIMTLDNEKAIIKVLDKVPIAKTETNQGGTITSSSSSQDVGLTLEITPQINRVSDFVKLEVKQTFETPSEAITSAGDTGIATAERTVETKVVVRNNDTVVIGGLLRENEVTNVNKVPLLGDIPLLGWLFKSKRAQVDKTNLILFLTPKVIKAYKNTRSILEETIGKRQEFIEKHLGGEDPKADTIQDLILSLPQFDDDGAQSYQLGDGQ